MQGILGACGILALAWALGHFHRIDVKKVVILLVTHILLAWILLKAPGASDLLKGFGHMLSGLQKSVLKGTSFVFGYIGGGPAPFVMDTEKGSPFILMFQALPIIVVMGSISMILFHTGILPSIVGRLSKVMEKTKLIGGGLSTAMAGKIFLGQTDTPLLVRPYLDHFTTNELFSLMTMGMATSVSTIFLLFSTALSPVMAKDSVLVHLATSTFINIIASLIIAECIRPQKGPRTSGTCTNPYVFQSIMQAIARGATDGWNIMMMIGAMMIAMIALIDIANSLFGQALFFITGSSITIQQVLGYVLSPLVWCMGIAWSECVCVGALLAEKTVLNEWVSIANIVKGTYGTLSSSTLPIMLYSLCTFANISSIGIQIACLGALAPSRLNDIVRLAPLALLASLLAGALSSAVVSTIL